MSKKKDIITMLKEAAALLVITLVAGLLLGFVYQLTKEPIAKQEALAIQNACKEVFPNASSFTEITYEAPQTVLDDAAAVGVSIGTVYKALDNAGNVMGYVLESTSSQGYGGNITIYLGVTNEGVLNDISILSISETAGLGMRAEEVLAPQFHNKNVETYTYTKTGSTSDSEIDAISGATITTKAVTNAVNIGLEAVRSLTGTVDASSEVEGGAQ